MPDIIARAKAATEGVTPGPWRWDRTTLSGGPGYFDEVLTPGPVECMQYCYGGTSVIESDNPGPDREFIAAARTLVPDLVALAENQAEQLAAIRALCADPFDVLEIEDYECECHDTPVVRAADILATLDGGER